MHLCFKARLLDRLLTIFRFMIRLASSMSQSSTVSVVIQLPWLRGLRGRLSNLGILLVVATQSFAQSNDCYSMGISHARVSWDCSQTLDQNHPAYTVRKHVCGRFLVC